MGLFPMNIGGGGTGNITDIPANFTKNKAITSGGTILTVSDATVNKIAIVKYTQRSTVQYPTTFSGVELIHKCSYQGDDYYYLSSVICFFKVKSTSFSITVPPVTLGDSGNSNNLLYT